MEGSIHTVNLPILLLISILISSRTFSSLVPALRTTSLVNHVHARVRITSFTELILKYFNFRPIIILYKFHLSRASCHMKSVGGMNTSPLSESTCDFFGAGRGARPSGHFVLTVDQSTRRCPSYLPS